MTRDEQSTALSFSGNERAILWAVFVFTILFRLAHISGPMDEPSWRQVWCTYQARELARESPPDYMHVKINFRGTDDVAVNNFPFYEGLLGLAYKCVGNESLPLARIITLLLFLAGTWCLYKSTRIVLGARIAVYTALVYNCLPLNLFYSRAVHYDILTLLFCHMYVWASLVYLREGRWSWYVLAVIALSSGFLLKPPFCMYLGVPLAAYVLKQPGRWRMMTWIAAMFIVPVLLAWWLDEYRLALAVGKPDSVINPDPYSRASAMGWFVGSLVQRLSVDRWVVFLRPVVWMVLTPFGIFASCWALLSLQTPIDARGRWFVAGWLGGAAGYILVVFPMVASAHDYYLLPLTVPVSMLVGIYLESLAREGALLGFKGRGLCRMVLVFVVIAGCAWYAIPKGGYFVHDWQRIAAGTAIAEHTKKDDLVVSTAVGRSTGWTDPRILYFADRRGWAVSFPDITAKKMDDYIQAGADYLAILITPEQDLSLGTHALLSGYRQTADVPLAGPVGDSIGRLVLLDVSSSSAVAP